MAATDPDDDTVTSAGDRAAPARTATPTLDPEALRLRLREEIGRAERHGTSLSCLYLSLRDADELAREHGPRLPEQALEYMSSALGRQLRRFDRVGRLPGNQLVVLLPGADDRRCEIVARRALGRLRAVKLELGGARHAIAVRVGLAAWREGLSAEQLLEQSRLAAGRVGREAAGGRDSIWSPLGSS